jgi:hypothetical protein
MVPFGHDQFADLLHILSSPTGETLKLSRGIGCPKQF